MSARIAEIRQENRSGDVSYRDIDWLCNEVERLRRALTVTYGAVDELCARPGTCMPVRPRIELEWERP